jgi:glutathione synthase/RimK-type ligase-like ATP-grasp enzyme
VRVVFATCDAQPLVARDDQPLADALQAIGIEVIPIPWTEIDPYALVDAPPVILRSTWDYHRLPTMFRAWLAALADGGRVVWNPPNVADGNIDKIYLRDFAAAGIAIPRTVWLERPDANGIDQALAAEGWPRAVLKPRIAATAYGTFLLAPGDHLSEDDLAPARASGALLQEFVPEILDRGEVSLVYEGRTLGHAVIKHAKAGDFRVQQDFGGRVEPTIPSPELAAFGDRVMSHVNPACLYARVDVVETGRGPLLMELELIEPELYFLVVDGAADRFAQLIRERLVVLG